MRVVSGAAAAAMLMLALTGCGSQATQPTSSPTVTVAPTPTASTPVPVPTPTTPTATATTAVTTTPEPIQSQGGTGANAPANQCADDDLGVAVMADAGGGGAGSLDYTVLFTNTGGSSCALRGTPGVSVVGDGNGTQLGAAADRVQTGVKTLTLAVGASVAAPLKIVNIGTNGGPLDGCTVQKGDGYRVYPPHSTRAFLVADPKAVACVKGPSFMQVGPVARYGG
jgi:hypothetical protein